LPSPLLGESPEATLKGEGIYINPLPWRERVGERGNNLCLYYFETL